MTANFSKLKVKYFTKTVVNSPTVLGNSDTIDARIEENFNTQLLADAENWIMAVERFELNLNGIPFWEPLTDDEKYSVIYKENTIDEQKWNVPVQFVAYSLPHFIEKLNIATLAIIPGGTANSPSFSVNREGFITVSVIAGGGGTDDITDYEFTFSANLQRILGLNQNSKPAVGLTWSSDVPRWDVGDRLRHIRLTSNLGVTSDSIGQSRTNVLTDVAAIQSFNAGGFQGVQDTTAGPAQDYTFTYSPRQKLIYDPRERRYLNILFSQPIIRLEVAAFYVFENINGEESQFPVQLHEGCEFSIKIGFYKRQ